MRRVTNEGCSILILSTPTITRTVSPHLVAGKAPWQTARCACRLARCACRSSSQKVLRYFLGALFARARSLRGKPCIEPCSERLLLSIQDPSTDARDDREGVKIFFKSSKILHFTFIICFVPHTAALRCPFPLFRHFVTPSPQRGKARAGERAPHTAALRCPFPLFRHFVTPSPRGEGKGRGADVSNRPVTAK